MSRPITLFKLAEQINAAGNAVKQYQIQFGELLIEAQKRVSGETNLTFRAWCKNYIFKKDGSPYSYKTIENAMWLARDPVAAQRDRLKRSSRDRKRSKMTHEQFISHMNSSEILSEEEQINLLMTVWEKTSDDAHDRFLELVDVKPIIGHKKQSHGLQRISA